MDQPQGNLSHILFLQLFRNQAVHSITYRCGELYQSLCYSRGPELISALWHAVAVVCMDKSWWFGLHTWVTLWYRFVSSRLHRMNMDPCGPGQGHCMFYIIKALILVSVLQPVWDMKHYRQDAEKDWIFATPANILCTPGSERSQILFAFFFPWQKLRFTTCFNFIQDSST